MLMVSTGDDDDGSVGSKGADTIDDDLINLNLIFF